VVGIDVRVEDAGCVNGSYRFADKRHYLGPTAFAEVWDAFDEFGHGFESIQIGYSIAKPGITSSDGFSRYFEQAFVFGLGTLAFGLGPLALGLWPWDFGLCSPK
jgi:hypothetical protein